MSVPFVDWSEQAHVQRKGAHPEGAVFFVLGFMSVYLLLLIIFRLFWIIKMTRKQIRR